ncbi:MAG: hypothetical protein AAFU79_24020 [Myxococcota bacterium]
MTWLQGALAGLVLFGYLVTEINGRVFSGMDTRPVPGVRGGGRGGGGGGVFFWGTGYRGGK